MSGEMFPKGIALFFDSSEGVNIPSKIVNFKILNA